MKKKLYEKPTMKVVKLQQQPQLLAASTEGSRQGFGNGGGQTW